MTTDPASSPDPAKLFSAAARQRDLAELQCTVGAAFGLTFTEMDLNDPRSVAALTERFARARVNGSPSNGRRFARGVARNRMLVGQDMAPAAALAATGINPDSGEKERFALIAFNALNNHVLQGAFGDLRRLFGAAELRQTERMTLLHEAGHVVVQHAEQAGAEAWGDAVAALDGAAGQAGDAIRQWAASDLGTVAHPEIRRLLLAAADQLDALQARVRVGEDGLCYDADALRKCFRAIRRSAGYRNFQENMGDAFMALKLRQEGVDVSGVVGDARAKGDPEHNTQPSLAAIGALTGSSLVGMSVRQLMVCAAQLVQRALRIG
ncbi:MAG: hypothetical protein ABTS22_11255 [Accumulibacter sp.]|uniref:hypothetical protein n=1 Tax=Accumulibacter sp. TaxID=2053492 RepID=UPI003315DFE3